MSATPRAGLTALLLRLPVPDGENDAALLARFVQTRDEAAFATIVRRHGAMVLGVCRRRLGSGADADDAYQVAFMALARDARKVAGECLAGWLYRVAALTALKLSGRLHRRPPEPLASDPAAPMTPPDADDRDLKAAIDQELAALPDRFRSVAVLCLVEGRTNTEAAATLGIPKGTVDSRLSTARSKLRDRLLRRGITAAAVVAAERSLESGTAAATSRAAALAADVTAHALTYAAGGALPGLDHLTTLADGVTPAMHGSTTRWLAAGLLAVGLLGTAGYGVIQASSGDKPGVAAKPDEKKPPEAKKPEDKKPEAKKPDEKKPPVNAPDAKPSKLLATSDDVHQELAAASTVDALDSSLGELARELRAKHGLTVRIDTPAFVRRGLGKADLARITEASLSLQGLEAVTVADVLREALGQMSNPDMGDGGGPVRLSYRVKGNQILIVPEFIPPTVPGAGANGGDTAPTASPAQMVENIYGEPVTVRYKDRTLNQVLEDLRERTGANIAFKPRGDDFAPGEQKVTVAFNDTRLLTVLKVVGDMCGLKPVVIDNVFYLTDEASAAKLQKQVDRDLFGEPPPAVPNGYVTDGYKLFEKPAGLKAVETAAGGAFSEGPQFRARPVPGPGPSPPPAVEKK